MTIWFGTFIAAATCISTVSTLRKRMTSFHQRRRLPQILRLRLQRQIAVRLRQHHLMILGFLRPAEQQDAEVRPFRFNRRTSPM